MSAARATSKKTAPQGAPNAPSDAELEALHGKRTVDGDGIEYEYRYANGSLSQHRVGSRPIARKVRAVATPITVGVRVRPGGAGHPADIPELRWGTRIGALAGEALQLHSNAAIRWELIRRPAKSKAELAGSQLRPDVPGLYTLRGTLSDADLVVIGPVDVVTVDEAAQSCQALGYGVIGGNVHRTLRRLFSDKRCTAERIIAALEDEERKTPEAPCTPRQLGITEALFELGENKGALPDNVVGESISAAGAGRAGPGAGDHFGGGFDLSTYVGVG